MNHSPYETRPLECWSKARELRLRYYEELRTAKEQGKLVVAGSAAGISSLIAGLGNAVYLGGETFAGTIAVDPVFSSECSKAAEAHGYASDICSYSLNYLGAMILDRAPWGGRFPRPDLCLTWHNCDTHAKWFQAVSGYCHIPFMGLERPTQPLEVRPDQQLTYIVGQMHDCVQWLERVTGKKYDDEKLIEAVRNELYTTWLWADIVCYNRAIPAPLDMRQILTVMTPGIVLPHRSETVQYLLALRDEIRLRVTQGIAAMPNERIRLLEDNLPLWHSLGVYKHLENQGAILVGNHQYFAMTGQLVERPDGRFGPADDPTPLIQGIHSRDDALQVLARWDMERYGNTRRRIPPTSKLRGHLLVKMCREWHADGVLMHLNRGCAGLSFGQMEDRLVLQEAGIPVATFEGNMADKRGFDQAQFVAAIDGLMNILSGGK